MRWSDNLPRIGKVAANLNKFFPQEQMHSKWCLERTAAEYWEGMSNGDIEWNCGALLQEVIASIPPTRTLPKATSQSFLGYKVDNYFLLQGEKSFCLAVQMTWIKVCVRRRHLCTHFDPEPTCSFNMCNQKCRVSICNALRTTLFSSYCIRLKLNLKNGLKWSDRHVAACC